MNTSTEKKELELFFRNLQQGLRKYSLSELNESISSIVSDKPTAKKEQKIKIDCVITEICNEFDLSRDELLKGRGKGIVQTARKHAYCILHFDLELPIRYIAKNVFYLNWHTSVSIAINYKKTLNKNIKSDREFMEKLEHLRNRINTKMNTVV